MKITAIRSDRIYRKMMNAAPAEKDNIYRDELMKPFAFKWSCVGIPLRAETEGGYDVVSAAAMSGYYAPAQITAECQAEIVAAMAGFPVISSVLLYQMKGHFPCCRWHWHMKPIIMSAGSS